MSRVKQLTLENDSRMACHLLGRSLAAGNPLRPLRDFSGMPNDDSDVFDISQGTSLYWAWGSPPGKGSVFAFGPAILVAGIAVVDQLSERKRRCIQGYWAPWDSGCLYVTATALKIWGQRRIYNFPFESIYTTSTDHTSLTVSYRQDNGDTGYLVWQSPRTGVIQMMVEYLQNGVISSHDIDEFLRKKAVAAGWSIL